MPALIHVLIACNVLVFLLQMQMGGSVIGIFALWPYSSELFMPWQVITYAFLHANVTHLAFNMLGLWMFGSELERVWGARRLGVLLVVSALTAAAAQLVVTAFVGSSAPTVGASGGLFGLLIGFAMVFPNRRITPLFPPVPMPAWLFVTLYGLIELSLGVTGTASGVAHFAHLGGLAGGWMVMRFWRTRGAASGGRH